MTRVKTSFLLWMFLGLAACGTQIVEFPLDGSVAADGANDSQIDSAGPADSDPAADAAGDDATADAGDKDAIADASADATADAEADAAGGDATADVGADAIADVGAGTIADAGADAIADAGADAIADAGADAIADAGADTIADADADAGPDSANDAVDTDTEQAVAPKVVSTSPGNAAVNVAINKKPTATFNTAMDANTVTNLTFTVKQGLTSVDGVVTYNPLTKTATFTPKFPLVVGLVYTATITTGAKDSAGNPLALNHIWTFTTGACGQADIVLGGAAGFVVLGGSTVTSTGQSSITGDLGVSPGSAVTGFPPGTVVGTQHVNDPTAAKGIFDLTTAYNDAAGRTLCPVTKSGNLGGQTLPPGLYKSTSSLAISSGNLTLDAQGDGDAIFIFQMGSTLTTTAGRQVILTNGAKSANVFWQVGTSATLGTTSSFHGTIMADQAITMTTGATLNGRVLARIGAVNLDSNVIVKPAP